jgi:hypothetical protein
MTPAELFARVDAVDAAAIQQAGRLFFSDKVCATPPPSCLCAIPDRWFLQDIAVAGLGNIGTLPQYDAPAHRPKISLFP